MARYVTSYIHVQSCNNYVALTTDAVCNLLWSSTAYRLGSLWWTVPCANRSEMLRRVRARNVAALLLGCTAAYMYMYVVCILAGACYFVHAEPRSNFLGGARAPPPPPPLPHAGYAPESVLQKYTERIPIMKNTGWHIRLLLSSSVTQLLCISKILISRCYTVRSGAEERRGSSAA